MVIMWSNPASMVVQKTEAEAKLTAIVADQFCKLRREILRRELLTQEEIVRFLDREVNRVLGLPPTVGTQQNPNGFVVACTATPRGGVGERVMFLVDRGRVKHSWWSDDIEDALVYDHKDVAERKVQTLHHNHPRVMPYAEALAAHRQNDRAYSEASA